MISNNKNAENVENESTTSLIATTSSNLVREITEGKDELKGWSLDQIEEAAKRIVKSGFTPLNGDAILSPVEYKEASGLRKRLHDIEVAKAVAICKRSQELQIPMMAGFTNLHALSTPNGLQVVSGYHIINALLRRAGCIVRFIRRMQPITKWLSAGGYLYDEVPEITDGNETRRLKVGFFPRNFQNEQVITNEKNEISIKGGEIALFEYDWITEVEIERMIPQPDGTFKTEIQTAKYTYLEDLKVINANHKGKTPHNRLSYKETIYEKTAFDKAARWIGDDLLLGTMEIGEFLDSQGIDYDLGPNGEVVTMLDEHGNKI